MPVPRRRVQGHGGWLWSGRPGDTSSGVQEPLFRDGLSQRTAIQTDNPKYAAQLLGKGMYVQLRQPRHVSTLLDELAAIARDAKAKGAKAPLYDLCKVSVPDTNLFCVESKGIPRQRMPQLTGVPIPGSPADFMPKNDKGEVDLGPAFVSHLQHKGYTVQRDSVDASYLRASQDQLDGAKVAHYMTLIAQGDIDTTSDDWRVWTTGDDYIIDGHHRWAGTVGAEFKQGQGVPIAVMNVPDLDITTALAMAVDFTSQMGIPPRGVGA